MDTANLIALALTGFSLLVFFYLGIQASRRLSTTEDFFLAGRSLGKDRLRRTLAASVTSLATVILAMLIVFQFYGFWLIGAVLSLIAGQFVFLWVATSRGVNLSTFRTVGAFVLEKTGSRRLGFITEGVSFIGFLAALLVEMIVGVQVFSFLFPAYPLSDLLVFGFIAAVVLYYIAMGGYVATVESDSWQFRLMVTATIALLVSTGVLYFTAPDLGTDVPPFPLGGKFPLFDKATWLTYVILVNLAFPIAQLASWQRVAATKRDQLVRGFWTGTLGVLFLWGSLLLIGFFLTTSGVITNTWEDVFGAVKQLGGIHLEFLYPLIFVGLVSALISTADSAAIAVIYSVFSGPLIRGVSLDRMSWQKQRRMFSLTALLIFIFIFAVFLAYRELGVQKTLLNIIFFLFGQLIVVSPLVFFLARGRSRLISERWIFFGTCIGWIVLVGFSGYGIFTDNFLWTQIGTVLGFFIALVVTMWKLKWGEADCGSAISSF